MRIGYDAKRLFNNHTGLGNYSRAVVDYMFDFYPDNNYHLFSPKIEISEFNDQYANRPNIQIHTAGESNASYWRSYGMTSDIRANKLDIYHGLSHELPRNISKVNCAKVVTIHDLIFKRHPEYFPLVDRTFYHLKWNHALKTADKVVAISEHTKTDIIEYYNVPEDKITVIYNTCHTRFYNLNKDRAAHSIADLPTEYMLAVGSIEPRKNYNTLIKALSQIPQERRIPLVIVGRGRTKYITKIKRLIGSLNLENTIQIRSDINDNQIVELYQRAEFLVFPSHYEGHGLPISEALLSGTPVISSETSSMKEAGGPHCLYFDPMSTDSIASAIMRITDSSDLKKMIAEKGKKYAEKTFDIKSTAEQMNNLYRNL